jgi:serine/threonine protein kinase
VTPELHSKLQEIFERALDLSGSERAAFLDQACSAEPGLRQRIDQLLEADDETVAIANPSSAAPARAVMECPKCGRCYAAPQSVCPGDGAALQFAFAGRQLIDRKYFVERRLGRGGMGAVYLVQHTGLEKRFALKLIAHEGALSPGFREGFENEARALGRLRHPNIVDVTDYGVDPRDDGLPYLVMEYLHGKTLSAVLKERKVLPFEEAIGLLRATAGAVDIAHQKNIVHGDLKPANLFLAEEPHSPPRVKVLDFGLARLTNPLTNAEQDDEATVSIAGGLRGTPAYMAPELLRGERATAASDRFAFGALTYELLTGETPFGRSLAEVQAKIRKGCQPPSAQNQSLPQEIDAPVLALLDSDPKARPATVSAAVSQVARAWLMAEQREWRSREWPRRLGFAAGIVCIAALLSSVLSHVRLTRVLEGRIADQRFAWAPSRPPDPNLVLVSLDDKTLEQDQRPLADRAGDFASMMDEIFGAGAKALAIDLLLPSHWSESPQFAKAVASHADRLALALFAAPSGDLIGMECLNPLTAYLLGPAKYTNLFGLVNLEEDEDRTIRHARLFYIDKAGQRRSSFAERAVQVFSVRSNDVSDAIPFWIDYSARLSRLPTISWVEVPARLQSAPALFRNRLVILGATFSGNNDQHRVPRVASDQLVPGQFVQALIANTILAGNPIHELSLYLCLVIAGLACFAATASVLCFPHRALTLLAYPVLICGYAAFAFWIFRSSRTMVAVTGPELTILFTMLATVGVRRVLSAYPAAEP